MRRLLGSLGPFGPLVPILGIVLLGNGLVTGCSFYQSVLEMRREIEWGFAHSFDGTVPFENFIPHRPQPDDDQCEESVCIPPSQN